MFNNPFSKNNEEKNISDYQSKLYEITKVIHDAEGFDKFLPTIEKDVLSLFNAERITIYQKGNNGQEIISKYKTGNEIKEIRLNLGSSSIAGHVAFTQQEILIDDVYEKNVLKRIHPDLNFDQSFDQLSGMRTRSMIVVPIKFKETLLGVMQIINRKDGKSFAPSDLKIAQELARIIGQKFLYEFQATRGPFDFLIQKKILTPEKLEEIKKRSLREKISVPVLLIIDLKLSPKEVGESLERYYQVPFLEYNAEIKIPQEIMKDMNKSYLKNNLWVPVALNQDKVTILIDNPNDLSRLMEIQKILNLKSYEFRVGFPEDIYQFLGESVPILKEFRKDVDLNVLVDKLENEVLETVIETTETGVNENDSTIVQLVNRLIIDAKKINASDIHVEPSKGKNPAIVRMRVDGDCREVLKIPSSHIRAVIARIKIMARLDIAEHRKPQDGKIGTKVQGETVELRVATIPTVHGESAVLRVLASGEKTLPLDKLNFSDRNNSEIQRLIDHPHGIFLVVGPTGSGKTTTLHAILGHINSEDVKIWTAEDPVEITQAGLQQVQVQPYIGFTFASALRSFLRADPDIILIGEMRDKETAHIGIDASLTGHLVFSTLHTNSASETITRLLGFELDVIDFADALLGVLAQRLLRTLCNVCKVPYKPSEEEIRTLRHLYGPPQERFEEMLASLKDAPLYQPKEKGCDKCGNTGYKGRTGIHELLVNTPTMKDLIRSNASINTLRDQAVKDGMTTLMQDGIWKVLKGQSTLLQLRKIVAE